MSYPCSLCRYYDIYYAECMKDEPCRYDNDAPAHDELAHDAPAHDELAHDAPAHDELAHDALAL